MSTRPRTPLTVARELRRRAGFGCCRCGLPVYQYHHIVPWHVEEHFRPDDMMILCPYCHDAATKGALSEREQRRLQHSPHNIARGYASGSLLVKDSYLAVAFGGTLLVGAGAQLAIDGFELFRLDADDDGCLLLSADLKDESGTSIALIERNEWVSGDASVWDMTSDHDRLKIRSGSRKIALHIDARAEPVRVSADLWFSGQLVRLSARGLTWKGASCTGGILDLGLVGFSVEIMTSTRSANMTPYLGNGVLVAEADPVKRLSKSVNAWRGLQGGNAVPLRNLR